ncbi:MAG: LytR/AlgR family response regulator transcription factor [Anaerorhabdus sp.]
MGIRILIAEDTDSDFDNLKKLIDLWADKHNQIVYIDRIKVLYFQIQKNTPIYDLLFLEIEMPEISGIEYANFIRNKNKKISIVFTTTHSSYAIKGYSVNATDYLIKPLRYNSIEIILNKYLMDKKSSKTNTIAIKSNGGLYVLLVDDILYIESFSHSLIIHCINNTYNINISFSQLYPILPNKYFTKCHRSYIINKMHVQKLKAPYVFIGDKKIPVSRNKLKKVKTELFEFYEVDD